MACENVVSVVKMGLLSLRSFHGVRFVYECRLRFFAVTLLALWE